MTRSRLVVPLIFIFALSLSSVGLAQLVLPASPGDEGLVMKWLGTAGWEIKTPEGTTILIDPFLTRKRPDRESQWESNEEVVFKYVKGADYIFAGHSHGDHVGDLPLIAKKFGAKIIGSRTTMNLALSGGVDRSQITMIRGGEKLDFKEFTVDVIPSEHRISRGRSSPPRLRELYDPVSTIMGRHFLIGGSFLYNFTFGSRRVLHQSTANFIVENLEGSNPDVALLAQGYRSYDLEAALRAMRPKVIIMHHFDQWRVPFAEGIKERNERRARSFRRGIKRVDPRIEVIIPDFLKSYVLNLEG